jgi:hypothetical protein
VGVTAFMSMVSQIDVYEHSRIGFVIRIELSYRWHLIGKVQRDPQRGFVEGFETGNAGVKMFDEGESGFVPFGGLELAITRQFVGSS